jgi:hypothetical protein
VNLEGSLDAFGIADVLALLRGTGKTGVLHVHVDGAFAELAVVDGRLAGAVDQDSGRLGLLRRLVAGGLVDEEPLAWAAAEASTSGAGLVRTLIDGGRLDESQVEDVARELVLDVLLEVLERTDGTFSFAVEELPADDPGLRLEPDTAISMVSARTDDWHKALTAVGGFDGVLASSMSVPGDVQLTPEEWRLSVLADGRRPVRRLCELGGLGRFATVAAIASLCRRGVLHVCDADTNRQGLERISDMLRMLEDVEALHEEASDDEAATTTHAAADPMAEEPAAAAGQVRTAAGSTKARASDSEGTVPDRSTVLRLIAGVREL